MKILQQACKVKRGSRVIINFSKPTNVFLMTEVNFKKYKDGASHKRMGGHFDRSPAEFTAPYDGTWHAVIEKGSHFNPMDVTGSVEILPPVLKDPTYFIDRPESSETVVAESEEEMENLHAEEDSDDEDRGSDDSDEEIGESEEDTDEEDEEKD